MSLPKRYRVEVTEHLVRSCEYLINADSYEEARRLAAEGRCVVRSVNLHEHVASRTAYWADELEAVGSA